MFGIEGFRIWGCSPEGFSCRIERLEAWDLGAEDSGYGGLGSRSDWLRDGGVGV